MRRTLLPAVMLAAALTACDNNSAKRQSEQERTDVQAADSLATPAPPTAGSDSIANSEEVSKLQAAIRATLTAADLKAITPEQRTFTYDSYDLNGDGNPEYLVGFSNSYYCGSGGCAFLLLNHEGNVIADFSVSDSPFVVLENKTNGWHDLLVPHQGGLYQIKYDGKTYPGNPSVQTPYVQTPGAQLPRLLANQAERTVYTF